jgi:hypothetical protein
MEWFFWVLCLGLLVAVAANIFNFLGGDRNGWRCAGTAAGIVAALTIGTAGYFANSKIKEAAHRRWQIRAGVGRIPYQ